MAIELTGIEKVFDTGSRPFAALRGVDLAIRTGSFVAIMGPSGSGKSTLLHCAAGLDTPTAGSVYLEGRPLAGLSEDALAKFRRRHAAFVFQAFNLLPTLTVQRNVELPMLLSGDRIDRQAVADAIRRVGLDDRADRLPGELSGGQQQRVAIARALTSHAEVIFADEPTGALDTETAAEVLRLLRAAVSEHRRTVLMTTHDPIAASTADYVVIVVDGRIAATIESPTPARVASTLNEVAGSRITR
ncbi:ABC transporter ATP-binding protein [Microbacterium sp. SZ1]|uniref:ABC transporter ATP-binding protein n=1 Tax=Microbacterium sp. SZ1 TaxID=1849736 RepID=UPI00211C80E5|nr:ABC transporter ATP-binding protein [Microbacterium sp. SZ1]